MSAAHAAAPPPSLSDAIREQVESLRDRHPASAPAKSAAKSAAASAAPTMTLDEACAAFYEARQFAPVWNDGARRTALATSLRSLADDGLNPADYHLADIERGASAATVEAQAAYDMMTTRNTIRALVDLHRGKVDPRTLDPQWNFALPAIDPDAGLTAFETAARSGDIAGLFELARPSHWLYSRMRRAYINLRALAAQNSWPQIADGDPLKPGGDDARVPQLRQRLEAIGLLAPDAANEASTHYDDTLADAVRRFQGEQYLDADGVIGRGTLAALNVPVATRLAQLRVNLERGRWLLHDVQSDFVLVDVAGFKISLYRDTKVAWSSRVQVGKPYRSTPIFTSELTYLTLNPTWTVPPTILRKDVLPKIRKDAGYLKRNRIRVFDASGRELSPSSVDWSRPGNVALRQDAGEGNSLGRVVLRFPNPYAVYLHDTPHKELFDSSQRAFSSGCIRVQNVFELVQLLLADQEGWDKSAIDVAVATEKTRSVTLAKPLPILIAYWTVEVNDHDQPAFKPDIYNRDPALLAALDKRP